MKLPTLCCVLCLLAVCACSGVPALRSHGGARNDAVMESSRGIILKELAHGGVVYKYAVYVPRGYTADTAWPCVLFLHGSGESGTDGLKQVIQGIGSAVQWNQAEWPCIIVMPQKPVEREQWEAYDAAVMGMLERTQREYRVDAARVSLTGLSQGGHGAWTFAAAHPGVFCAIAPICGYGKPMEPREIAARIGDVPVWAFHGLADDVVPPKGTTDIIDAVRADRAQRKSAAEVRLSLFEGVNHGSWDRAYRQEGLAAWLLGQRLGE